MKEDIIPNLVSTIIPVYNRPKLLREAVSSVLEQTYRPIEIIIVNDGSTDDTIRIVDELAREYPDVIRVIHQVNTGPGLARETGRLIAKGEFIQYLDSDDLLLPEKFELQVEGLKNNPDYGVSYGYTRYRYKDGQLEKFPWKGSGAKVETMFPSFLKARWWDTPTPLYRTEVCNRAGPWTDLKLEEDWEYDCRIASQGIRLHFCKKYVAEVRDHESNRLCRNGNFEEMRFRDRAKAHILIYNHAKKAGINHSVPEMQHFARELFLLSRQCGAAGLDGEPQILFNLSRKASGIVRGKGWDFRIYALLARFIGWKRIGKIACFADKFRHE